MVALPRPPDWDQQLIEQALDTDRHPESRHQTGYTDCGWVIRCPQCGKSHGSRPLCDEDGTVTHPDQRPDDYWD